MTALVGIGSPHGDDWAGWVAVEMLRPRLPAAVASYLIGGAFDLLEILEGHDVVFLVDAAAPAGKPGTIRSFTWPCPVSALPSCLSTHGMGLVEALRLAEALGSLPRHLRIHTIEARDASAGAPLSEEVAQGLETLVEDLLLGIGNRHAGA